MSDYKNTLLMPFTLFEMKANLKQKEPLTQQKWFDQKIYEKCLAKNKDKPQFILHDGPPYANGSIHIGHALNKIIKDVIVRYKLMNNFYAPIIYGWDTHGLPIENAIAKMDKHFDNIVSPLQKRLECKKYALEQVSQQKKQFARLGLMTDLNKHYLTLDKSFQLDELKLFATMIEKQLVFQDFKPVYWSWSTRSALAEAEIIYDNITSPSIYVGFETTSFNDLIDDKIFLLIWTTTPWTIPSNLAIAVNPNLDYALISFNNKKVVMALNLVDKLMQTFKVEHYEILKTFKGFLLENIKYQHPFRDYQGSVILADYVSSEDGTGLVHNAPGFGIEDYYACKKYNIDVYCPINEYGKFDQTIDDNELEDKFYLSTNDIIIDRLRTSHNLFYSTNIVHSAAHDWRTKKPIIYRATKQWFINIEAVAGDILNILDKQVTTFEPKVKERLYEMISKRKEWCISRQRVWGVPIIMIYDENMLPIYDVKLIHYIIDILDREGMETWFEKKADYFIPEWMDKSKKYYKEKDIIDVWFDSGSSFSILIKNHVNYPADLYFEGSDQFRGWFNSSLINSVILHHKSPFKQLLQHGFVLDEKGNKMSKSLNNTIDPLKICDEYGADILRIWATSNDYSMDMRIGKQNLDQCAEIYRRIRNTLFRYSLSNLNDFNPSIHMMNELRSEDIYVLSQLDQHLLKIKKAYERYDFITIIKIVNNFTIELSQWYFDIIKDDLYCQDVNEKSRRQAQTTIYWILYSLLKALNPIIPHTCEEAYQLFNCLNKKESINLENFPELLNVTLNDELKQIFSNFFELKNMIYPLLEESRKNNIIKKFNEATVYINDSLNIKEATLAKWLNVAKICIIQDKTIVIKNEQLHKCQRCWNYFEETKMYDEELCNRCLIVIKN